MNVGTKRQLLAAFLSTSLFPGNGSKIHPASTCQKNWLASAGRVQSSHAWPMLLGWRVWHSSWQGLFSAPPALRSGHKQPLSTSSPLPKSGGKERRPWLSHRHPTVPHTGRSPLLLAPRRSLLIQSQHNGAEMAPLILLGRRSRYMVGISNDFLPHGTGSQDLALCTAPQ